jgi:AcrR family transcriptional regulator
MPPPKQTGGRTYGGESPGERAARRRRAFVEAGIELFGQVGYRKATVRLLCQQAGLTDRYFYESFSGGMEDLLAEVYDECITRLRAGVLAPLSASAGASAEVLMRGALDGFFAAVEDARLARIIWLEVLGVSPRIDQLYTRRTRDFAELLVSLARGMFPRWPADEQRDRLLAIGMIGAVSESAKQWLLDDYRAPRASMVEAATPLFVGMLSYLGAAR